jgi:hypothetical protein
MFTGNGKYIVGEIRDRTADMLIKVAIPFTNTLNHSDMKRIFHTMHSAGFFELDVIHSGYNEKHEVIVRPYGRSESLNLDSDPIGDLVLLKLALNV